MVADYGSLSWVKRGRQRRVVVMAISRVEAMTPTEISYNTKDYGTRITLFNITDVLNELITAGIVLTEEKRTHGKLYGLSQKGKDLRNLLMESSSIVQFKNDFGKELLEGQLKALAVFKKIKDIPT